MVDLLETIRLAADDPMWANHAEVPKKLLRHVADRLEALERQLEALRDEDAKLQLLHQQEDQIIEFERRLAERDADLAQEKAHSENFEQYWRDTEAAMARVCAEVLQVQADIALKHADYDGMDKSDLRYWMIAIDAALAGSGDGWPVPIVCDVLTIQHSSGYPDHFTRIKRGDRQLTIYMSKIKGQCEYHAAEFDWLLNGATKPDILAFDDTEPEGLSDYLKSLASPSTAGER